MLFPPAELIRSLAFLIIFASLPLACGGAGSGSNTETAVIDNQVVARSEGFSERPDWADPNQPFTRRADSIRVLGYIALDEAQRTEAGFRAADSYARAELVRFLSTRVVAVLEDRLSAKDGGQISEMVSERAHLSIDALPITERYWELRKEEGSKKRHLFSRVDINKEQVKNLLSRLWKDGGDVRTPLSEVLKGVDEKWDALGTVSKTQDASSLVPEGVYTPTWASSGDSETDQEYRFVCHGLASDDQAAVSLAKRMCSEKLCRLFGVQITSETTVTETLDGIDMKSEVKEGCPQVRVEGRRTEFQGGECGPRGCVEWLMHSYPKSEYQIERKRLDEAKVVERHVVVQEGSIKYQDPAVCEKELRAYGRVQDRHLVDIQERLTLLKRARRSCSGIDPRDAGLFGRIWHLLEKPLSSFVNVKERYDYRPADDFLVATPQWREELSTERFMDQRIGMVVTLLKNALPPLIAYETAKREGTGLKEIQAAMKPLYAYPFTQEPIKKSHRVGVHKIHNARPLSLQDPDLRAFLFREAQARPYSCYSSSPFGARQLLSLLIRNEGSLDDEIWRVGVQLIKADKRQGLSCLSELFQAPLGPSAKVKRLDQIVQLIKKGLRFPTSSKRAYSSETQSLMQVVYLPIFSPDEKLAMTLRHQGRLKGSEKDRQALGKKVLGSFRPRHGANRKKANACALYADAGRKLSTALAGYSVADFDYDSACECLKPKYSLNQSSRHLLIEGMAQRSYRVCAEARDDEWPGFGVPVPQRPEAPPNSYPDTRRSQVRKAGEALDPYVPAYAVSNTIRTCLSKTKVYHPSNGVLPAWTSITVHAENQKLSRARVQVHIQYASRKLRRRDPKGWVTAQDRRLTENRSGACIEKALENFSVVPKRGSAEAPKADLWFLFSGHQVLEALFLKKGS